MANEEKKYTIRVNGEQVEVSKEIYYEYMRPIWRTRKRAQTYKECICPQSQLWKCDGICQGCKFHTNGMFISSDTPIGGEDDEITLGDTLSDSNMLPDAALINAELIKALYSALEDIDPDGKTICKLFMENKTDREIAAVLGKPQSTISYIKKKAFEALRKALKDYR